MTSHLQFPDKLHLPHIAISSHDLWYPFQSWDQSCRIPASIRPSTALKRPWPLPGLEGWWCQGRSISACTSQKAILLEGPSQPNDGTTYFEITLLFWLCSQNQPSSGGTWEQKFANHLWGHIRIAREIFRQQLLQCPPNLSASVSLDELLQGWNISPNPKTPHALATVYSNFSGGLLQYDVFCLIVGSMIFFLETHLVFFWGVVLFRLRHSIFVPVSS